MVIYRSVHRQLFRYDAPNVSSLFLGGSVKVTTLETCRKAEKEYFGDEGEGTQTITSLPGADYPDANALAKMFGVDPAGISVTGEKAAVTKGENAVRNTKRLADAFIFCASALERDPYMLTTFGNGCVEITDPIAFFELVDAHLREAVAPMELQPCVVDDVEYAPRVSTYRDSSDKHIAFLKPKGPPKNFERESEVRAIWIPSHQEISPKFLNIPAASKYLGGYAPVRED